MGGCERLSCRTIRRAACSCPLSLLCATLCLAGCCPSDLLVRGKTLQEAGSEAAAVAAVAAAAAAALQDDQRLAVVVPLAVLSAQPLEQLPLVARQQTPMLTPRRRHHQMPRHALHRL